MKSSVLLALGILLGLAACNTVGGFGRDMSSAGQAVTGTANEVQRKM